MNEHLTETHRFIPFFPAFSCPFFREGLSGQFVPSVVEKDAEDVQTYTRNGIAHYILSNENVHLAAWVNGTCECYIVGNLEFEEFITMIDSIYV